MKSVDSLQTAKEPPLNVGARNRYNTGEVPFPVNNINKGTASIERWLSNPRESRTRCFACTRWRLRCGGDNWAHADAVRTANSRKRAVQSGSLTRAREGKKKAVGSGGGSWSQGLRGRVHKQEWPPDAGAMWPRWRLTVAPSSRCAETPLAAGATKTRSAKLRETCKSTHRQLCSPERPCLAGNIEFAWPKEANARSVHPSVPTRFRRETRSGGDERS